VYEYAKGKDACMRRMFHPAAYFLSPPSYLLPIYLLPHTPWQDGRESDEGLRETGND
jgi:hypothetical protein